MYSYKKEKLPKNTTQFIVDVPKIDIKKEEDDAFSKLQSQLTVEGFRPGKAPKDIAQKHISKETLYQELAQKLISQIYQEIITKESLKPIISPKVDLVKAKEGEDWQIKITVAEKPLVELGDYKKIIKEAKEKAQKANIWVPGKDKEAKKPEEDKNKLLNDVLTALLKETKLEISDLVVDEEINHRLTHLVDEIQKIGLTTENYLKSKNLTMESLKTQFRKETEDTYKLEFVLSEIADKENIKIEKTDLDKLFVNIKDEKERKKAEQNSYYYATILRKQKTLDYLISL
ncbi:MAG: Trigger factor [Candidatus Roizmanbacteria bacterium GW2011_GWA2_34_18]|uniref:Trigger factor n=1 Tax=Candidatus Roizmanbacteria bacterium GW2011_GWA2_34_18 TaxID=1618477 RepID=A0A0G0BAJ9_9BACT|nr:MAG: Trigger factor [Candidatus Roizmanbacteria bacterium GW2011_GWA2_34_18]